MTENILQPKKEFISCSYDYLSPQLNAERRDQAKKLSERPNQTGDGINFASKISGHVLVFQPVVLLCWSTICNVDPWLGFLYTVPPHPLISMLWRALFIHLRNLFREKADAAQSIKEQNNIEIGGRGEHEERLHRDKHCTTQKKSKLLFRFTCEINSVTSTVDLLA